MYEEPITRIDLNRTIQVKIDSKTWKTADYVTNVLMEQTDYDYDKDVKIYGLSFNVALKDGTNVRVTDAFGLGYDTWRYREQCCEQCEYHDYEGGDAVPYGSTTVNTPEGIVCNCEYFDGDVDDPYDHTNGGFSCPYFKRDKKEEEI